MGGINIGPDGLLHADPVLPAHAMTTYAYRSRQRKATCAEVGCEHYLNGWLTIVPAGSEWEMLVRQSGRRFTEQRLDGLIEFRFEAGQACFQAASHRLPWEGHERFFRRGGDWRGNPRGDVREFQRPDDFVDDWANHQIRIADQAERG